MAHERLFWDIALEHEDGVLVYREVIWTIGRQCGKTVALLVLMLWRCLRWPGQVVRYGAQTGMDARAMLAATWWPRLEHSPLAEVLSLRRQSGHEGVIFENTSRLGLLASTEKSAHGATLDAAVPDGSWAYADLAKRRIEPWSRSPRRTHETSRRVCPRRERGSARGCSRTTCALTRPTRASRGGLLLACAQAGHGPRRLQGRRGDPAERSVIRYVEGGRDALTNSQPTSRPASPPPLAPVRDAREGSLLRIPGMGWNGHPLLARCG